MREALAGVVSGVFCSKRGVILRSRVGDGIEAAMLLEVCPYLDLPRLHFCRVEVIVLLLLPGTHVSSGKNLAGCLPCGGHRDRIG